MVRLVVDPSIPVNACCPYQIDLSQLTGWSGNLIVTRVNRQRYLADARGGNIIKGPREKGEKSAQVKAMGFQTTGLTLFRSLIFEGVTQFNFIFYI